MPSLSKPKARKNRAGQNSRVRKGRNRKLDGKESVEIWVLAGGLSSRMGRDKAKMRLGRKTTIGLLREKFPTLKVQRKDVVARCGPLGGVLTVLKKSSADRVVLLACDMPLVTLETVEKLLKAKSAAFCEGPEGLGFPFVLNKNALPIIERQVELGRFSIHELARVLKAKKIRPARTADLLNLNTPADVERFNELVRSEV